MTRTMIAAMSAVVVALAGSSRQALAAVGPECTPNPLWDCPGGYTGSFSCEDYGDGDLIDFCQSDNPNPAHCAVDTAVCSYNEGCEFFPNGGGVGESIYCHYTYTG